MRNKNVRSGALNGPATSWFEASATNRQVSVSPNGGMSVGLHGVRVITVAADATGLATVTANAPRLGSSPVMAASPAASGTLRFVVVGQ